MTAVKMRLSVDTLSWRRTHHARVTVKFKKETAPLNNPTTGAAVSASAKTNRARMSALPVAWSGTLSHAHASARNPCGKYVQQAISTTISNASVSSIQMMFG